MSESEKLTEEQKLELMAKLGEELGHVITLREDPKPPGADPQVWEMLDKPKPAYKKDKRTLKYVVRPRGNRKNLAIIFENDSEYSTLQYHDHSTTIYLKGEKIEKAGWEDIALDLEERYRLEVKDKALSSALFRVAFHKQIYPIKDYLEGLEWDGVERLATYATDILKAETTADNRELIEIMSTKMFIGPVARIFEPGCEMHSMPIFIGDKGVGKSMCIKLVSPQVEWFDRTNIKIGDKSALEHIHQTGVWLQEMAELADFQGKHANKIKSFLTTEKDRYRIVYDKDLVYKPRRICFFGTSNDYQILDDGWERRFWIFKITDKVDLNWIIENRNQLWAEAVHLYKSGKEWHLLPNEEQMLRTYQESFLVDDPWAWGVAACIDHRIKFGEPGATTDEIMEWIQLPVSQRHTGNSRRVAQICRDNGFVLIRTRKGRFWTRRT